MMARVLPAVVVLALILLPASLNRTGDQRVPLYTPDSSMVAASAALLNDQGVELYYDGRLEESLAKFILSSDADPSFAIAHYNCAVVLSTRGFSGDLAEALRHLEWSYKLDPENQMTRDFLMELMQRVPFTA